MIGRFSVHHKVCRIDLLGQKICIVVDIFKCCLFFVIIKCNYFLDRVGGIYLFLFDSKQYQCPFDCFIHILKGKWRTSIILLLAESPQRFAQLQRLTPGISAKVLSENLQVLEENSILHREVYPTVPPTVEYRLTEEGTELVGIMNHINQWSNQYFKKEENFKM